MLSVQNADVNGTVAQILSLLMIG